jgi:hypothetical protein
MVKPQRYADLQQSLRQAEQQIAAEVGITRRSA